MDDKKSADEALHYIRGRLAALDSLAHALGTQRADRRFDTARKLAVEAGRIRWALSFVPEDCNFGNDKRDNVMPELAAFAGKILESWPDGGDLDGGDLQEIAAATGVLVETEQPRPCGADCSCLEYYNAEEWPVKCFRLNLDGAQKRPEATPGHV